MSKRIKSILLIILVLFLVACSEDVIKPETDLEDSLEATMKILTSEGFKGRLAGTEGKEKVVFLLRIDSKKLD